MDRPLRPQLHGRPGQCGRPGPGRGDELAGPHPPRHRRLPLAAARRPRPRAGAGPARAARPRPSRCGRSSRSSSGRPSANPLVVVFDRVLGDRRRDQRLRGSAHRAAAPLPGPVHRLRRVPAVDHEDPLHRPGRALLRPRPTWSRSGRCQTPRWPPRWRTASGGPTARWAPSSPTSWPSSTGTRSGRCSWPTPCGAATEEGGVALLADLGGRPWPTCGARSTAGSERLFALLPSGHQRTLRVIANGGQRVSARPPTWSTWRRGRPRPRWRSLAGSGST